jgi:hypothetical protein
MKRRQPFLHLLKQQEEPKTNTEGPTMNPAEHATPTLPRRLKAESASKEKCWNAGGGQRKSLKRLDSAKESEDFDLDFVPPDLEFVPPGLGFRSEKFGFPSSRRHSWAATGWAARGA